MSLEIKKSAKPVKYSEAVNLLESRLKDLHDKGVLNNEEFKKAKDKLLK